MSCGQTAIISDDTMTTSNKNIGLYEFLIEAELQQYYNALKSELKVGYGEQSAVLWTIFA